MQTVKAIYDGANFKLLQPAPVNEKCEVTITFFESAKKSVRPPFEYGSMSETFWMADDFDAPLEEFKEYME